MHVHNFQPHQFNFSLSSAIYNELMSKNNNKKEEEDFMSKQFSPHMFHVVKLFFYFEQVYTRT